jgi:DNA-binding beta-propeller fold protein YncE
MTTGFTGGGLLGPGFGTAIDANDRVWATSTSGQTISLFDNSGKPLSPPEGYNFGGKLRTMQGVIVTPAGDVWALDFGDDKVVYMPGGDPAKAKFFCQSTDGQPNKDSACKLNGPFGLAIDQQDRIWITNAIGDTVTRFPAADPSKIDVFPTGGGSGKGMAIDSKGNAWITNTIGSGLTLETKARLIYLKLTGATLSAIDRPGKRDDVAPRWQPCTWFAIQSRQHLGRLGGVDRRQRPCLDFQLRTWRRSHRAVRRAGRNLPGGHEDGRSDFPARRLQGWWHAIPGRCLHRPSRRRMGVEQLAG